MRSLRKLIAVVIVLCSVVAGFSQDQDLRQRFGTESLDAAKQIGQAIQSAQSKKYPEARTAIEAAIKADGRSQMAYYWKGIILANLGEVPDSIAAYKKALSNDVTRTRKITASAATNLGVLLGKLNELDESNAYFTQVVLTDFDNALAMRGNAYRSLAVNAERRGQFLASTLLLSFAHTDKAKDITPKRIAELYQKARDQEVARLLHFPEKPPTLEKRRSETKLSPAALEGSIPELISELWPDPQGRYLIAIPANSPHYYRITTGAKVSAQKIKASGPILGSCLAGGQLYVVSNDPGRIDVIAPDSGKVVSTHPLNGQLPKSLAVFPSFSRAFYPGGGVVHDLNLKTGAVTKTTMPAEVVTGHPSQRFVFTDIKSNRTRWQPSSIFKTVVVPNGLLLAEVRDNAASNGTRLSVSPDGNWVALAGGGGWRPMNQQSDSGYGVAVFSAVNLEQLQGFFTTDAYPRGVCFNPVTAQVAVIRDEDAAIYHLADAKVSSKVKGPFSGAAAWSGDGRYLFLASAGKGLTCWSNSLSEQETQIAGTWWKNIKVAAPAAAPVRARSFPVVTAARDFQLKEPNREDLSKALARALAEGNAARPVGWQEYGPYLKDDEMRRTVQTARQTLRNKEDFGITIYQVKAALKTYPDSAPLKFFLAEALRQGNQPTQAQTLLLDVVHADAGRTELSYQALNGLASILAAQDKDLSALHCLTTSLLLDRANPRTLEMTQGLLKKNNLTDAAEQLAKVMTDLPRAPGNQTMALPRLAKPSDSKKLSAAELYRASVPSVVLVQAGDSSGSGVCIGSADTILTNNHVVENSSTVDVYPFAYQGDTLVRLPKLRAKVVFESTRDDLAVLKLDVASRDLRPLPVAERTPQVGERVYAIGSPGLGGAVLEQSVSEGIISATNRVIEDTKYLQHTAAINPGNSGGPLIDEWGRLAGVVTLKAHLENVGFAVPVETVRTVFKSP